MRASELTNGRELRALQVGEALNRGSPPVWGLSVPVPRPRGIEFLRVGKLPKVPGEGELITCQTFIVATDLQELLLYVPCCYT